MNSSPGKSFYSTLVLCLLAFVSYAQYDSVFTIPYPKRYEVINSLIRSGKDSAARFSISRALLEKARQKGHDEQTTLTIEQAILAIELLYKIDVPHTEQRGLALISRAEKINCHPIIAYVDAILGDYFYNYTQNYVRAFEYYEYYIKECDDYYYQTKSNVPDMVYNTYCIANDNYKFYDYNKSLKYAKGLLTADFTNIQWVALLVNDLVGMSYVKLQQYDSAIVYFRKTLELAPRHHEASFVTAWQGIATGNIGLAYYLQKKYDTAIPYLLKGEELTMQSKTMDNVAAFAVYLANIYTSKKNTDAAQKQLAIARDAAYKSKDLQNYYDVYTALSGFYRQQGNIALTLQYQDSSLKYKDSLAIIRNVTQKYGAEISVANERRALREKLIEQEKQKQILIRNGSIALTLIALVFVLLFYNRQLLKQKYRREQLLAEKQITEAELVNAQRLLGEFTKNITEKNEMIESLREKTSDTANNEVLQQLQQSTLLTDEQWEKFRELFEKAHAGYLYRLKEKLPGLTPAETRFMALTKLKLSNKEMSAMLGNSPDAIRQYRSRIRKKFNIPEQNSIEDVAETI